MNGRDNAESATAALLDELVERVRVASFEAPKAQSHTEWAGRIKAMFSVICGECGISEDQHDESGTLHESGEPAFWPLLYYRAIVPQSDGSDGAR